MPTHYWSVMNNTGYLSFRNKNVRETFLSLSKAELNEFETDLAGLLKKINKQMQKQNIFEAHILANERVENRNFRVELFIDLHADKEKLIILQQFRELSMDEYLDSINSDKSLKEKGFIKLK